MYMPVCKTANQDGAQVLHGCRRAFQEETKWPVFRAFYRAVEELEFGGNFAKLLQV